MSLRRLHHEQPASFAFSDANKARVEKEIAKYPAGRQASAVIAALWIGQEQEGWVTKPMVEAVAHMLDMPPVRVLEVATFYTMFNLKPVGKYDLQVCMTLPCSLMGADHLFQHLSRRLGIGHGETTPDGRFTLRRVECLAACGGGPCLQVNEEKFHENLDEAAVDRLLETLK